MFHYNIMMNNPKPSIIRKIYRFNSWFIAQPTYSISSLAEASKVTGPLAMEERGNKINRNSIRLLPIKVFVFLFLVLDSLQSEDLSAWTYSCPIYLNTTSSGANVSNDVYNFPVLLRLNPGNFPYFQQMQPGGKDIPQPIVKNEEICYRMNFLLCPHFFLETTDTEGYQNSTEGHKS